ncbi:MAG: hypothetical protein JRJ33_11415 [Deltaproteobacteria bacterium]|nr:hypothetical protein [Deltaproteobacteria bacterium]
MIKSIIRNIVLTCLIIMVLTAADSWSRQDHEIEPSQFPSLMTSIRANDSLDFCGEPVALEEQEIRERLEKELLLTLWDRPQVILWIKRSARYLPLIPQKGHRVLAVYGGHRPGIWFENRLGKR